MSTLVIFLQILCALALVILLAVQTDKAEQGGVMGLGGAGGRSSGEIDMAVGPERILKPLTRWTAIGFLATSVLSAIPSTTLSFVHILVVLAIYLVAMLYGNAIWRAIVGSR